jgi:hypothetical protein
MGVFSQSDDQAVPEGVSGVSGAAQVEARIRERLGTLQPLVD